MKLSLSWLKEYISLNIKPDLLAHKLTMAGLEVKGIDSRPDGDFVFEIEVTPNRPDCLNVVGIAREVSAILNKTLKSPALKQFHRPKEKCDVAILDPRGCSRYIGTVIADVKASSSPEWIQKHIASIGLRSINNIVDITNFCLFEIGQPLHAFDLDKLTGGKIIVRKAREGESIITIDGVLRKLDPSILVIADEKRPVAIAGIMGGKDTEVTTATKNILLESAYFDPLVIRRACRHLGISSDSSYRFERSVDMDNVEAGAHRAAGLIKNYSGGSTKSYCDLYPGKTKKRKQTIRLKKKDVDQLLGFDVPVWRMEALLKKMDFKVQTQKDNLTITVPAFRNDVRGDVDIIEEVARIIGYDAAPATSPIVRASNIPEDCFRKFRLTLSDLLVAQGLSEIISYTTISQKSLQRSSVPSEAILKVKNTLTVEQEMMRPSLLPGMLSVVAGNINKGQKDLALFELGKVYSSTGECEKEFLGIMLSGKQNENWRKMSIADVDFYDAKGIVEEAAGRFKINGLTFKAVKKDFLNPYNSASICLGKNVIGNVGALAKNVLDQWDIKLKNIFYAELELLPFYNAKEKTQQFKPVIEYPAVVRDVSLAVKRETSFESIQFLAYEGTKEILASVTLLEQYGGDKIPSGYRGMTISLSYQSGKRTLREEEVNVCQERFVKALQEKLGATIR